MNAETKVQRGASASQTGPAPKRAEPPAESQAEPLVPCAKNMALWNAVSKTDPRHTKKVNQRGGFTAISAHYQVMSATAAFGPVGIGWGYTNGDPVFHDTLVIVPVTLWHGERSNQFGPLYGAAEWKDQKGRIDSDAAKKASTDGLTKGLSQLGFNADVFLGRFDDNKYVADLLKEFEGEGTDAASTITDEQRDIIQTIAPAAGKTVQGICEAYKVTSLNKLTEAQAVKLIDRLQEQAKEPVK